MDIVPTVALPPLAPFTCHVTAVFVEPVTVAVNCCVAPVCTDAEVGAMVIPTVVTVTVADADFVVSACETAVTVTVPEGAVAGAVYKPEVEIVPTVVFPPVVLFTCQVTAVFVEPVTVAVNCCVAPVCREAVVGEMVTATVGAVVTVTEAVPDLVESA